jgi:hypothetical protein
MMLIGRDPNSGIYLQDNEVSMNHASIVFQNGQYVIRDNGSRNGTYVNGEKATSRILAHNDQIVFGPYAFLVDLQSRSDLKSTTSLSKMHVARGGRDGARESLQSLWKAVSDSARFSPVQRSPLDRMTGNFSLDQSPGYLFLESMSRMFSPYDLNPLGINPLRGLLNDQIDFDRVNALTELSVHVTATNVRTGRPRVFGPGELSTDAVLASACLPQMFPAVEIDGEAYWDGGFSGNPALYPLLASAGSPDILVVQINPILRATLPRTARDIMNHKPREAAERDRARRGGTDWGDGRGQRP